MRIVGTVLVALVVVQRVAELRLSGRNRRRLLEQGARAVRDAGFGAMVASHVVLLAGCGLEPWLLDRTAPSWIAGPALVLFLAAQSMRAWVIASLGEHWNVRILASGARGVVTRGPYRWIRHPNYLVVLVEVLTLPLVTGAWITWAVVQALHTPALVRRIRDEERALLADPAYREAMEGKPRFLPGSRSASR